MASSDSFGSTTLKDFIPPPLKKIEGDVGMELEVEAMVSLPNVSDKFWVSKEDGSLRFIAKEYVTNGAVKIGDVPKALISLARALDNPKWEIIKDSPRTSFHVHVNVRDLTHRQIATALYAYWYLEPVLLEFAGRTRKGNCFCLTLEDSVDPLEGLETIVKRKSADMFVHMDNRYASQNLASLSRLGTIENRLCDGNFDPDRMADWVMTLHNIVEMSKKFDSPVEVLNHFYRTSKEETIRNWLIGSVRHSALSQKYDALLETNELVLHKAAAKHRWGVFEFSTKDVPRKTRSNSIDDVVAEIERLERSARPARIEPVEDVPQPMVDFGVIQPAPRINPRTRVRFNND